MSNNVNNKHKRKKSNFKLKCMSQTGKGKKGVDKISKVNNQFTGAEQMMYFFDAKSKKKCPMATVRCPIELIVDNFKLSSFLTVSLWQMHT